MKRLALFLVFGLAFYGIALIDSLAMADQDKKISVSVAFGRGLNTARPPGDPEGFINHAILPDNIKVDEDGVVHFLVAGFHQIIVYNPGKELDDVVVPAAGRFVDDTNDRFYTGIVPATVNPPPLPVTTDPSNSQNRVESISFAEPGTYLVICNVRAHFNDGMFAFVKVKKDKD